MNATTIASIISATCDIFFLGMFFYKLLSVYNVKPQFIQICVVNLISANFIREICALTLSLAGASFPLSTCIVVTFISNISRVAEYLWGTVIGYSLFYKVSYPLLQNIPGEKYLRYLIWCITILLCIITSTISSFYPNDLIERCNLLAILAIIDVLFWLTILFNTIIFIYLVYLTHLIKVKEISLTFYILAFVAFGYLRVPYFIKDAISLTQNGAKVEYNFDTTSSFFGNISGAVFSLLFSYNLGYLRDVKNKLFCKSRGKKDENLTSTQEIIITSS